MCDKQCLLIADSSVPCYNKKIRTWINLCPWRTKVLILSFIGETTFTESRRKPDDEYAIQETAEKRSKDRSIALRACMGVCLEMRPVWCKRNENDRNFNASNWLFAHTTHIDVAPEMKFCMRGRVREVVIYLKFHQNRSRGLGAVGGGRKSPSPIDKAHGLYNSLYYHKTGP